MKPIAVASKAVRKYIMSHGEKASFRSPAPLLARGVFDAVDKPVSDRFTAGFGKEKIIPPDLFKKKYYIAGYGPYKPATGILDLPFAHALWLDDNTGRGAVVFVSLDVVGFMNIDVERVRGRLAAFCAQTGCRSVNVMSTHNHAGIDTMGLWGPLPRTGKNKKYMEIVFAAIDKAVRKAYEDRRPCAAWLGEIEVEGLQEDIRLPEVYSKTLTRVRFVPDDGSREIYWINFAAHSESLGGKNTLVSADHPCYLRREIKKAAGAETFYCVGAIGGMISMNNDTESPETTMKLGRDLAGFALAVRNETKLEPVINILRQEFYAEADNSALMAAARAKILEAREYGLGWASLGVGLKTEMSYIEIGRLRLLLLPGEIFPELVYGGYLDADHSACGDPPSFNPEPLAVTAGGEPIVVIGLANDEIGYIVPPNDFLLDSAAPYFDQPRDRLGRRHYEETNSLGPNTAPRIAEIFADMMQTVRAKK
ncbi:MAG TPA: hypothetical protein PL044_04670 [Clostridiales bacterium]|nr:hypothetical protein [Clostridiales bacterium]HQK73052.1 hypothetical protein [Clostridiales bacterium]